MESEYHLHDGLEELGEITEEDELDLFELFKDKESGVNLHKSTKMFRAIDLPDNLCRVIIFQKLPFPMPTPYHKALEKKYGSDFLWAIMRDECNRELIQGATRGIRNKDDWCFVVSPDSRVNQYIKRIFFGNPRVVNRNFTDGKITS